MDAETDGPTASDVIAEACRLLRAGREAGLEMRLLGGVAIALRVPRHVAPLIQRDYNDIDVVVTGGIRRAVETLITSAGYRPNQEFNALHGNRRLLYYDDRRGRQVDVFVNAFTMCHAIPLGRRLLADETTLPLAELLLTKLQIVELNDKDQSDILTLLYHHALGDQDGEVINARQIGALCARDWGLWRTTGMNVERSVAALGQSSLADDAANLLAARLAELEQYIAAAPKTTKWKLRARVGDRVQWYDEPEEVD